MKISIEYKLAISLFIAFCFLLLFSIFVYNDMGLIIKADNEQTKSQNAINAIKSANISFLKIAASARGYALTGQISHLYNYRKNIITAKAGWYTIENVLKNDSAFNVRKQSLANLISDRIAYSDSVIMLRQKFGVNKASELLVGERGTQLSDLILKSFTDMENRQLSIIEKNNRLGKITASKTRISFLILLFFIFVFLITVFIYVKNDLKWKKKSFRTVKKWNEILDFKVQVRTKALISSQKKYRFLVENATDLISTHNLDTRYRSVSESCINITGYVPEELIDNLFFDFIHPKDLDKIKVAHTSLLNNLIVKPVEFRFRKKDGTYIWMESFFTIIPEYDNQLQNLIICIRDISERKNVEEKLLLTHAKMNALFENSSDSIWSIDTNFNLISFNSAFFDSTKIFFDIEPFVGMSMLDHLNLHYTEIWPAFYKRALGGEHFSEEVFDDSLGGEFCFDISFNPIIVNNEVTGVAIFSRDITARKNFEKQLNYKIKELDTFIYKATHDLRSPLVSVMGLVDLAKEEESVDVLKKYTNMIDLSVRKMDNLLIDLVKIVNVSQGEISNTVIEFEDMLEEILFSLQYRPGFSEIVFRKQIHVESVFKSDKALLYSVLQNIIDNAIKYRKVSSEIEPMVIITIDIGVEEVKIGVTDNGIGIQEDSIENVFDMFYRGTVVSTGTGLGLYIVKTSVEKLGGKVVLNSLFNKGTSVNIYIPNSN